MFIMNKNRESARSVYYYGKIGKLRSLLGPILYVLYTAPLREILPHHNVYNFICMQMTLYCICFVNHPLSNPEINRSKLFIFA